MDGECCENCKHWSPCHKKAKSGWCKAWQFFDYHESRGRGSSRFVPCGATRGVIAEAKQWCARWKAKGD